MCQKKKAITLMGVF